MHGTQNDLGVQMRKVQSPGIPQPLRGPNTILCDAYLGVVWMDDDRTHEDLPDSQGSREGNRDMDQIRFEIIGERTPSFERLVKEYIEPAINKENDRIEQALTPSEIIATWPQWKQDYCKAYLDQPYVEEPNRGNGAW